MELSQLAEQHRANLEHLYNQCHRTYGKESETAFKELDSYLETHNLSLAMVGEIMGYGSKGLEEDFLELA